MNEDVNRVVLGFDALPAMDKRHVRRLMAQVDGEGEGSPPSCRGDLVATLPAALQEIVTAAMTSDGLDRIGAARVLAASEPWLRASPSERSVAAWAVSTFDGDGGGFLRSGPGLDDGLRAVLGHLDRSGRWVDPPGAAAVPVDPFDLAELDWEAPVPPRQWLLEGLVPQGRVSALYGAGESGKSRFTLQLALGVVGESDAPVVPAYSGDVVDIPTVRSHGPVLLVTWEDEPDELRRRVAAVRATAAGPEVNAAALQERLGVIDMRAVGGPLWAPRADGSRHTSTEGEWTEAGRRLLATMERDRPALVVVDPIAAAYACSEVDRGLVRRFVGAVDAAAESSGAAVLLVGHPAKGPAKNGDSYSGSTDWRNGVRGLLTLGPADTSYRVEGNEKPDGRKPPPIAAPCLRRDKSSYGPAREPLWLVSHYKAPSGGAPLELCWFGAAEATAAREINPAAVSSAAVVAPDAPPPPKGVAGGAPSPPPPKGSRGETCRSQSGRVGVGAGERRCADGRRVRPALGG